VSLPVSLSVPIAETREEIAGARFAELVRQRGERARRHLVRLLDWAIRACEEANTKGRTAPPPLAAALLEQLQLVAGQEARLPASNQEVLNELLELQELYLLAETPADDTEASAEEARS
jgi:hypothetical protein